MAAKDIYEVELRLKDIAELYQRTDLSPASKYFARYSPGPAIEYVLGTIFDARRFPKVVRLKIQLPDEHIPPDLEQNTLAAVQRYLLARRTHAQTMRRRSWYRGKMSLSVGLAAFIVAFVLGSMISSQSDSQWIQAVGQAITLLGWVMLWYPIDQVIYDRWKYRVEEEAYADFAQRLEVNIEPAWAERTAESLPT